MKRRLSLVMILAVIAFILAACGGGSGDVREDITAMAAEYRSPVSILDAKVVQTQPLAQQRPLASVAIPNWRYGGVAPAVAVEQLLDYAEAHYPGAFPGHPPTQLFGAFHYRAYPDGVYLGVAVDVQFGDGLTESGVYVIYPPYWGQMVAVYVGQVLDFITPVQPGTGAFALSVAPSYPKVITTSNGQTVEIVLNSSHQLALAPNGWPGGIISVTPGSGVSPPITIGYVDWNTRTQLRLSFPVVAGGQYTVAFTLPDMTGATATLQVPTIIMPIS